MISTILSNSLQHDIWTDTIKIRSVETNESVLLSELSIRSKAHWDYDQAFMQSCKEELSHSPHDLNDKNRHYGIAELKSELVGFYTLEDIQSTKKTLFALFIKHCMKSKPAP